MSEQASVLLISPYPEDRESLSRMLPSAAWHCRYASNWREVEKLLRDYSFTAIIAESEIDDHPWFHLKEHLTRAYPVRNPPVIVTSSMADDQLWAEVLNLGGYNVLAKPFRREEVAWVLGNAASQSPETRVAVASR